MRMGERGKVQELKRARRGKDIRYQLINCVFSDSPGSLLPGISFIFYFSITISILMPIWMSTSISMPTTISISISISCYISCCSYNVSYYMEFRGCLSLEG